MSTPDASGATNLLPRSIYEALTQIYKDFQQSLYRVQCRQTLAVAVQYLCIAAGTYFEQGGAEK